MISKNRIKNIRSLAAKKNRDALGLFVAEGPKVVGELLSAFSCVYIAALPEWLERAHIGASQGCEVDEVSSDELHRISFLQHPQEVLAVFRKPEAVAASMKTAAERLCLALDGVQDPGNVGTIIRIADWFGITDIYCSVDTADAFGPKVVQASMGALARVHIYNVDLMELLKQSATVPVYGTFLDGTDIYETPLTQQGFIVMGSEGNGISEAVAASVSKRLFVPSFPAGRATSESLNVAVATAIVCSEFRRRAGLAPFCRIPNVSL